MLRTVLTPANLAHHHRTMKRFSQDFLRVGSAVYNRQKVCCADGVVNRPKLVADFVDDAQRFGHAVMGIEELLRFGMVGDHPGQQVGCLAQPNADERMS